MKRTVAAVPSEWLDLAAPLLREEQLMSFLQMTEREKDEFIRTFWKRRST